jgi:hypothetical protein
VSELVRIDERVPAGDRIDFYQEMCAGTWVPMDVRFDRACERVDVNLVGEFRASGMGAMQVVVMRGSFWAGIWPAEHGAPRDEHRP